MERDFDSVFQDIVSKLGDMPDPSTSLSIWDINHTVMHLSDAASQLSRFAGMSLVDENIDFPDDLVNLLPLLNAICNDVIDELVSSEEDDYSACDCEQCELEYGDDDD